MELILLCHYEDDGSTTLFEYFGKDKTVVVPDGVTDMEMGCFSENKTVEEIILPQTLKSIGEDCFKNCPALQKIVIPESVESIFENDNTFEGCPQLTIYTLADSVSDHVARAKNIRVMNKYPDELR